MNNSQTVLPPTTQGERRIHSFCIAATQGGGGKTLLSIGIARALSNDGLCVKPFKKGPDYIDAAWLSKAARRNATNLDPFFLSPQELRTLFFSQLNDLARKHTDLVALVEGNRGLYDGLDAKGSCSTAELTRTLGIPIVLVINCTKMTRTVAALLTGLFQFEPNNFAGIILNCVGTSRQASLLREVVEQSVSVPILGILPRLVQNPLKERHMGLASYGKNLGSDSDSRINFVATFVREHIDLKALLESTRTPPFFQQQPSLADGQDKFVGEILTSEPTPKNGTKNKVTLGYVIDQAFWFYYEENLQALRDQGALLIPISALEAERATLERLDGLYIGGGFPEDYADRLSTSPILSFLNAKAFEGLPIYAECGGFMLLAKSIHCHNAVYPMAGVFNVVVEFFERPQGLGYVEGTITHDTPYHPKGCVLKGHEFHYSRPSFPRDLPYALTLSKGQGMGTLKDEKHFDALIYNNVWASYTHIFALVQPTWAKNFVEVTKAYKDRKIMKTSQQ